LLCFWQSGLKLRPASRALIQSWLSLKFFRGLFNSDFGFAVGFIADGVFNFWEFGYGHGC
jgi:hypothetical protein